MKIAIVGFGKMGRAIEKAAKKANHEIVAIIDPNSNNATASEISAENLNSAELAIDFTHPKIVLDNVKKLTELKIPTVIGTTGWYSQISKIDKLSKENSVGVLYSGNFSIGVQIFYAIIENAAKLLNNKNFDVAVHETHHAGKADAPSGTAKEIAEKIFANFPAKKSTIFDNSELPIPPEKLQISASRIGKIVGIHEVFFDGESDSIQLIHTGKNRNGYAIGAIAAGEWLIKKNSTGLFSAKDWLGF